MKKLLLSLAALVVTASSVSADTLYELTFNKDNNQEKINDYVSTWKVKSEGNLWTLVSFNNYNNGEGTAGNTEWTYVRCGRKNNASIATITNDQVWSDKINEIVINAKKNKSQTNDKVTVAKLELLSSLTATTPSASIDITDKVNGLTSSASDITISINEPMSNAIYRITFDMPGNSNNGWLQINSIKYNGTATGPVLSDPEISFPGEAYEATLGMAFDYPVATAKSTGKITYTVSNDNVATVNAETGEITLVGEGTTVVTATIAATDTYKTGSASYTLTVVDPTVVYRSVLGEDFTLENVEGETYPWSKDKQYGLKGTGYINREVVACEGIAASPVFDMTKFKDIKLYFNEAFNNYKINNQNIDVADFEGYAFLVAREEGASEWTVIENAITAPESFSWTFYPNATVDLSAYDGKKFQFGFKYVSTDECAGTWEVKDIKIRANNSTGVADVESDNDIAPVYYNLQGVRVDNPENGLYIEVKGNKSRKVIF